MKKILSYTVKILGGLVALFIICWLLAAGFVIVQKKALLQKARTELSRRVGGASSIGDLDISFFRLFPSISLHANKVVLRDSLWEQHHHDLVNAENLYVSFSLFKSIFSGKVAVGKVYLEKGTIYLFTDSMGYSNTSALSKQQPPSVNDKEDTDSRPPEISLSDVHLVLEKQNRKKLFDLDLRKMDCSFERDGRALQIKVNLDAGVKSFALNTEKGSFLKDKTLSGRFSLQYNTGSKILQFDKVTIRIGGHPFRFSGRFFPTVSPDPFYLSIGAENILFKDATALLTPALHQKLDGYAIDKPVTVNAVIDAGSAEERKELITVKMNVSNNSVNTPAGRFNDASFQASFTNEWVHGQGREDENSGIRLIAFTGNMENIPVRSDTINIVNLKKPVLSCDLRSQFDLTKLNELAGSKSFQFEKGTCLLDLRYKGPLSENDTSDVAMYGKMTIDSGAISYMPYDWLLDNVNGKIRFDNQDVFIEKLNARAGNSSIQINGTARGIVSIMDKSPDNVVMDLHMTSPNLDLEDFTALAGKSSEPAPARKNGRSPFGASSSRLDRILREGLLRLQMEAVSLRYKKFTGAHAKAELVFNGRQIKIQRMLLDHSAGTMTLTGELRRQAGRGGSSPLSFVSHFEQVDLPKTFTAFSNFGQSAIRDENLKGKLNADITMTGWLTEKGRLANNSLRGKVSLSVKDGQLIHFEPMEKVQETVLKKRDMSDIRFSDLTGELDLDSTTITIHRMEIPSSALTVYVEGVYDMKTGADMSLVVPLSNLKGRDQNIAPANKGNDSKAGLSVRLRAKTQDDGKLKISWDPFRKGGKKPPKTH